MWSDSQDVHFLRFNLEYLDMQELWFFKFIGKVLFVKSMDLKPIFLDKLHKNQQIDSCVKANESYQWAIAPFFMLNNASGWELTTPIYSVCFCHGNSSTVAFLDSRDALLSEANQMK